MTDPRRAQAEREIAAVNRALAAGYPPRGIKGNNHNPSAIAIAAKELGLNESSIRRLWAILMNAQLKAAGSSGIPSGEAPQSPPFLSYVNVEPPMEPGGFSTVTIDGAPKTWPRLIADSEIAGQPIAAYGDWMDGSFVAVSGPLTVLERVSLRLWPNSDPPSTAKLPAT